MPSFRPHYLQVNKSYVTKLRKVQIATGNNGKEFGENLCFSGELKSDFIWANPIAAW